MTERNEQWDAVLAQVVLPLVGLALTYWVGTHAATIEIELRGRWARLRATYLAGREGVDAGRKVAEWFVREEAPKVVAHAEDITREAAGE
jgi:hypothetical protein